MSGVRRFLSRRERSPHQHGHQHRPPLPQSSPNQHNSTAKPPKTPDHFTGIFTVRHDSTKQDKEEEKKVRGVLERLRHYGINSITESNIEYALQTRPSQGDPEAAFRLLMLLEDTYEGIVRPYDPNMKLLGAVNRDAVTCYLDSLLFAMFVRLDSFEALLYDSFEDAKRKRLAGLLRLWVNLLRTGRLITTDITAQIQKSLAECGWTDAGSCKQQDPSEAFTFITGQLELPMLTLKMDMYHTGKEDPQDDHKFVNERLLEVAILDEPVEGKDEITLEDCLEHYFNNRIEVKRHLEMQRRNTLKSAQSVHSVEESTKLEKGDGATQVEVTEVPETPIGTPLVATPLSEVMPTHSKMTPVDKLRPSISRKRADSIFSQRKIELTGIDPEQLKNDDPNSTLRKLSTRTEVLMPAWQFFKLLPWYTDNMPVSDAQVAAHFSQKRPVLGICLKRYSYTNTGQAKRLGTYVDIPLEITVPDFVSDEHMDTNGPSMGNFRLMLQSVVCHRGVSVDSGHYICFSRVQNSKISTTPRDASPEQRRTSIGSAESGDMEDPWISLDDLRNPRVSYIDIHAALRKETPYLLFYQVQPIGEDGQPVHNPPTYEEATSRSQSDATPLEKPLINSQLGSETALNHAVSEPAPHTQPSATGVADFSPAAVPLDRTSLDAFSFSDVPVRGRTIDPDTEAPRRTSITIDTTGSTTGSVRTSEHNSNSIPSTPSEDKNSSSNFLSVAGNKLSSGSRRGSRVSKASAERSRSRPSSRDPGGGRLAAGMNKLTQMVSNRSTSNVAGEGSEAVAVNPPTASTAGTAEQSSVPATAPVTAAGDHLAPPIRPAISTGAVSGASAISAVSGVSGGAPSVIPSSNPSKESVTIPRPMPTFRKEREKATLRRKQKHADRDCVLM